MENNLSQIINNTNDISLEEKTLSSELKYTGCVVNVRQDDVVISNGSKHCREVVEHSGGVVIIPIMGSKVILIRQWRHPVGQHLIELPAGKLNPGEDPLPAAKRELTEETGYTAKNWEYLGYIYTTPGFCNEKITIYKATDLEYSGTNFDFGEIIEPFTVEIKDAVKMVRENKIVDSKTIVGLGLLNGNN